MPDVCQTLYEAARAFCKQTGLLLLTPASKLRSCYYNYYNYYYLQIVGQRDPACDIPDVLQTLYEAARAFCKQTGLLLLTPASKLTSCYYNYYNYYYLQIVGQTDPACDMPDVHQTLYEAARAFCKQTGLLLLTPASHCLPGAGGDLKTSIDVSIAFPGGGYQRKDATCKDWKVCRAFYTNLHFFSMLFHVFQV